MKLKHATDIIILFISILFTLFLGEMMIRIVFNKSMDFDMEMWKYATQVKIPLADPLDGHDHEPGKEAYLMGSDVKINSQGLRDKEYSLKKPDNTYRIVVIGDSITFGWGVEQEFTYPDVLEKKLNEKPPAGFPANVKYEVLNLGVGNYNTFQEVRRLKRIGLKYNPDLVLMGFFINDAEPSLDNRGGFLIENSYLFALVTTRIRTINVFGEQGLTYNDYYSSMFKPEQRGYIDMLNAFGDLKKITDDKNIPAAVFLIPELHDLSDSYPFAEIHRGVIKSIEEKGLPAFELFPYFRGYTPEEKLWVSYNDAHHNAEANALLAKGIYEIMDKGLVKPAK